MVELKKETETMINTRNATNMMSGEYGVNLERLHKDIDKLEEMSKQEGITAATSKDIKMALWILKKWEHKDVMIIGIKKNEDGNLESYRSDTECDGIRGVKLWDELDEIHRLIQMSANMNVKYLKLHGQLLIVDLSQLIDALAFEYNIIDEYVDAHSIDVWTREATVYTVNKSKIITDMVKEESNIHVDGELTNLIRGCRINEMCPKIKLNNEYIITYLGEKIEVRRGSKQIDKIKGYDRYDRVINACVGEIMSCVIGKVASDYISRDIKIIGMTGNCELAIDYTGNSIPSVREAFSVVAKVFMKRYLFEPNIYMYNEVLDRFKKIQ